MDAFKTFDFQDGRKLELYYDEAPMNPREWDNIGTMAFFHKNYDIGDKDHGLDTADFGGWEEMAKWIVEKMDGAIVLPVRMYDHSGIGFAMGTDAMRYPFNCKWDSMMVGFMYVTKAKLIEEFGDDSDESKAKATKCMQGELEVYNQYHDGDVYGFVLRDKPCEHCDDETGDELDSCWGFFGHDPMENGIAEYLSEADRKELETLV